MFRHGYVKPKHGEKKQLFFMDTDSFITYIKADDIYKDILEDVEARFHTSQLDRPLPIEKNRKVI